MKDTPLDGTPRWCGFAPAFVPKKEAERLGRSEASISVTETGLMKRRGRRASLLKLSRNIKKADEATVGKSRCSCCSSTTPPFQPAPPSSSKHSSWTSWSANGAVLTHIPQKLLSPVGRQNGYCRQKAIRFTLGDLGRSSHRSESVAIWLVMPTWHLVIKRKRKLLVRLPFWSFFNIDLERTDFWRCGSRFQLEAIWYRQLQFWLKRWWETPEGTVVLMGKTSSVQFDNGELTLSWDDSSYNKSQATYSRRKRILRLSGWI